MSSGTKFLFLALIFLSKSLYAQSKLEIKLDLKEKVFPFGLVKKIPQQKPIVSLALSGGGSRAIAHIGLLKALEEKDIQIDHLVGTSMGSVIGGLYSSGYEINELDSQFIAINWDELFFISGEDRRNLFVDQKITEDKALFTVRLNGLSPVIPQSLNTGNKITNLLISSTLNAPLNYVQNFDSLLFKYRAVATELVSGRRVVIDRGCLSDAMRASSSVSFLLPPIKKDSLLLVDGGLVDNLPIKSAEELNPDFIIACDATSALKKKEDLVYPWDIADQIVTIPSRKVWEQNKFRADKLIQLDLKNKRNNDFSNLREIIDLGYKQGSEELSGLKEKLDGLFLSKLEADDTTFSNLVIRTEINDLGSRLNERYFESNRITKSEILYELYSLYETGDYKDITAEIELDSISTLSIKAILNPAVSSVVINGAELFPQYILKEFFTANISKPYNTDLILESALRLIKLYRSNGYMSATIEKIGFEEGILDIEIDEGIINDIVISGNENTLSSIVEREFPSLPGEYLMKSEFDEDLQNLSSTDLFENISINLKKNSPKGKNLNLSLEEKIPTVLRFGLRIDNENFTQAALDIRNENLFGTGSELGFSIAGGSRNLSYKLEHKTNRIFDTYLTYKAQAYYKFNDVNVYAYDTEEEVKKFSRSRVAEYRQKFYGGFLGVGAHLKRLGTLTAEAKYEVNEIDDVFELPEGIEYKLNISSLRFRLQIDSQNKYPYATRGIHINTYYETAQKIFGGDVSFAKFSFDYEGYFTLAERHTISPKLIFGFADETLPLSQQFNFGGQFNFLGYRDYEFRGRQILITSLEYRYKLPINIYFDTYLKLRYDLGSSWNEQEQIRFNDLKHGFGLTLSFDTPIGPADFSLGRSLLLKDTSAERILSRGPFIFYFTIGYYY